nr:myb/SANT-like DNA-binding domain-containing protein 3 [Leptinotarsa decemlineata]
MASTSHKNRAPNFTYAEKVHLMRLIVDKYADTIEDKKTDRVSAAQKEKTWELIESEFNASSSSTYRNAANLKKCYENRKKELRKSLAEERKQTLMTGRGPPPKIKKDDTDDILMSILNKKTLVGLHNEFDDDANLLPIRATSSSEQIIEYTFDQDEYQQPNSEHQNTSSTRLNVEVTREEDIPESTNHKSWKKYTPVRLEDPVSTPLVLPEEKSQNNEAVDSQHSRKTPNRRRPTTVIKPLTSSHIAQKYDMVLDKRLQILDIQTRHMEEENALIIKKRKLEIELLEIELANKKKLKF